MRLALAVLAAACLLAAPACAQTLTGVGGTFPAPVYAKWGQAAKDAIGIELTYDAAGSGRGQDSAMAHTADFGASDAPMPHDRLAAAGLLQFPTLIGAVVVIVNLPHVREGELKLTGEELAAIYAGKIRKWNDPRLAETNPGVTLPNVSIATVHRYEPSGTSYAFTAYLAAVSPAWRTAIGTGTQVAWPAGAGAIGNDGVATTVMTTRGGIGYVEYAFASQNHLSAARLRNHAGAFVRPTEASFAAAVAAADWTAPDFAADLIDTVDPAGWPLMAPTFALVSRDPTWRARTLLATRFFDWAFTSGGAIAAQLAFIPLPKPVQDSVRAAWRDMLGPAATAAE
ncbi:MAG TPA: phosphate ABC transporter substrate-binding protein PstS [Acidisphaera sp.]|nr:phosphate ABC transporter substrate-binding protein PstS [Acidisphaera sp.]